MVILVNLLMVILAAVLIGLPFLRKGDLKGKVFEDNEVVTGEKELLFSALGEIEFDYRMNKISDEDYQQLKSGYQQEAMEILAQEEKAMEKELEKELLKHRKAKKVNQSLEKDYE